MSTAENFSRDQQKRIAREIYELNTIGPESIQKICIIIGTSLDELDEDDLFMESQIIAKIQLLPKSPIYQDGRVPMEIRFTTNYPVLPPTILFSSLIFHPNVDIKGKLSRLFSAPNYCM